MANKENIKKLLSDNKITKKKNLKLKYKFPYGFHIPENNGCSILCRVVLGTIIKSLDYSGSLIGISISSRKPFETSNRRKTNNNKKKAGVGPPPMTEMKNTDGEIIRLVQVNCSLSTPIEYSLFRQYLNESLQFSIKDWCAEFENIYNEINEIDAICIPKLMICTTSPGDDICNQWIEFIQSIVPPLFDNDDNKFILHHWDDKYATICIMDQLIRVYNEDEDEDEDEEEDDDDEDNPDQEEKEKILVQDLNIGHYVQSIMDHTANIFNFIHGKTSTIYKNVNADSTIVIDCDLNQNIGKILQFMKNKYLDPNPQTPSIQLFYSNTEGNLGNDKHGARYVQFSNLPSLEFVTNSSIRSYKNAYFVSHDSHQQNIVHYVLTKNNRAYIVNNEKLGVLIWYFLRCLANHTSISNTIHIFLSVGRDSSSDYLDFLDITKIEIYSHDKKSYREVIDEYADECIICIEYKQSGNSIIVFSQNIVEKLQYISDKNDSFTPEDALLDFYRLFESGNNDSIINFLIAQLSLQLFHIGISEWIDIYDIDLLSLYQHSITVKLQTEQQTQQIDSPLSENDEDESEEEDEYESESQSESEDEEEDDSTDVSISDTVSMDEDDVDELLDLPAENEIVEIEEEETQRPHQVSTLLQQQEEQKIAETVETDEKIVETDEIQSKNDQTEQQTVQISEKTEEKPTETEEKPVETEETHNKNAETEEIIETKEEMNIDSIEQEQNEVEPQEQIQLIENKEKLSEEKETENEKMLSKPKVRIPSLNQSQSTDVDPDIGHTQHLQMHIHGHTAEASVDIDSYANKMSANDRTQILNDKKKKHNKRMVSVTLQKLQKDLILNGGSPATSPAVALIAGGSGGGGGDKQLPLRERALLSYQNSMKNQRRWQMEDDWLSKQRAKQSRKIPLKSQKSLQLLQRVKKLNENQKNFDDETKWRAKLEERNKKNTYKKSPTALTNNINKQSIIKPEKPERISTNTTSKTATKASTPKTLASPVATNHRRHTSASQQAIIKKLTKSADEWKRKYKDNDGDDTLTELRKKSMSSADRQKQENKMQLSNVPRNNINNKANKHNHNSNSVRKVSTKNINNLINAHIDRFMAAKEFNNTLLKDLILKDENADLILLGLQIRKIDKKENNERLNKIELIFEEKLNIYQTELLNIQNRFELDISNNINDEKDEKNDEEIAVDGHGMMDDDKNMDKNEENSLKILRDLNILINNDTILNMNNLDITNNKNGDVIRNFLKNCIINNRRLVSIQFINTKGFDDKWLKSVLNAISCNAKILTQLLLNNNKLLTDKSIKELAKYIQSNPPCLRVLKLNNLSNEMGYNVISTFLKALNKNTQIIKVIIDTQTNQQQSKLRKILNRNWKRYVKERRLKKTLLTQIQNRKIKHDKKNTKKKNVKKKKIK